MMINEVGIIEFNDMTEAFKFYSDNLLKKDKIISKNTKNLDTYKKEIIELHPVFFKLRNPKKVIFNLAGYSCQPWWVVGEILTEMLGMNPPFMSNYRYDMIEWSYDLLNSGRACYGYGCRWLNFNSFEKTLERLQKNPTSKRIYIPIFDQADVGDTRDAPCNVGFSLLIRNNKIDLTLYTRSIDVLRGFRYDLSLFSFILQIFAKWLNVEVGSIYYLCNSLHCYGKDINNLKKINKSMNNQILELDINDEKMEIGKTYDDLRKIVDLESVIRNQRRFDYHEVMENFNYKIFRDFFRVLWLKNETKNARRNKIIDSMETKIQQWFTKS